MKLVRASYRPYGLPLKQGWSTGVGFANTRAGFLLELRDDRGGRGFGDVCPLPSPQGSGLAASARQLDDVVAAVNGGGVTATLAPSVACDDGVRNAWSQAVLTLEALERGQSLAHRLREWLPGPPPLLEVPVNFTLARTPQDETVRIAQDAVRRGYSCLKLKVGGSAHEVERVAAVRAAVGPRVALRLDANGAWTEAEALQLLRRLAPLDIEYVEQPISPGRIQTFQDLRKKSPIAFAADESSRNLSQARALLERGVVDVIVVKPPSLGGLDRAARLVELAREHRAKAVVTDSLDTAIGRTGALHLASLLGPGCPPCGLATGEWLEWDVVPHPVRPQAGRMAVPQEPGLGIDTRPLEELG